MNEQTKLTIMKRVVRDLSDAGHIVPALETNKEVEEEAVKWINPPNAKAYGMTDDQYRIVTFNCAQPDLFGCGWTVSEVEEVREAMGVPLDETYDDYMMEVAGHNLEETVKEVKSEYRDIINAGKARMEVTHGNTGGQTGP